jgi:hypothetical protein
MSYLSREFNHRVKSISMATFKPEEIKGLQEGGNKVRNKVTKAKYVFFISLAFIKFETHV